jgi:hypothetical protein
MFSPSDAPALRCPDQLILVTEAPDNQASVADHVGDRECIGLGALSGDINDEIRDAVS